jgi:hypothetical protein
MPIQSSEPLMMIASEPANNRIDMRWTLQGAALPKPAAEQKKNSLKCSMFSNIFQ